MTIAWSLLAFVSYNVLTVEASEKDFLSPENVDRSITLPGENEPGFIKTPEQKRDEELEVVADLEDDLADAETSKQKEKIQGQIDKAKERFGLDKEEEKAAQEDAICDNEDADYTNVELCMSDKRKNVEKDMKKACDGTDNAKWTETGCVVEESELTEEELKERAKMYKSETFRNLLESKGIDYDDYNNGKLSTEKQDELETEFREDKAYEYGEEINSKKDKEQPEVIEDWGNTVKTDEEQARDKVIKILEESEEGNEVHGGAELEYVEAESSEEDDNQVNTDTDDSSDNTDSSDSQDSSDSEDDGGDSSDSSDDSSSSDDGGDSGDSSESEE